MPELRTKKVGIIACSGEECAEGLVSRLVALRVLHDLRPGKTVTLCLPLFLAGGEGDRSFAKLFPTIAVDGCEKQCAFRATEKYSKKPAASFVISKINTLRDGGEILGLRKLNPSGQVIVETISKDVATLVDGLLGTGVEPAEKEGKESLDQQETSDGVVGTCSCGSNMPVMRLQINGKEREMLALPLIFDSFLEAKGAVDEKTADELLEQAGLYTAIPGQEKTEFKNAIYQAFMKYKTSLK